MNLFHQQAKKVEQKGKVEGKNATTGPTRLPSIYARPCVTSGTTNQMKRDINELSIRQQRDEYAAQNGITYKPCCDADRLLQRGIHLYLEQRRVIALIAALLTRLQPDLMPPMPRTEWCNLLSDDPNPVDHWQPSRDELTPSPFSEQGGVMERLSEAGIIRIPQLKHQFIQEWRQDQESRPDTLDQSAPSLPTTAQTIEDEANWTSADCYLCWNPLNEGPTTLYKLRCCNRLVHLECVEKLVNLKCTQESRICLECHHKIDLDEQRSIEKEWKAEKRRRTFMNRIARSNPSLPQTDVSNASSQPQSQHVASQSSAATSDSDEEVQTKHNSTKTEVYPRRRAQADPETKEDTTKEARSQESKRYSQSDRDAEEFAYLTLPSQCHATRENARQSDPPLPYSRPSIPEGDPELVAILGRWNSDRNRSPTVQEENAELAEEAEALRRMQIANQSASAIRMNPLLQPANVMQMVQMQLKLVRDPAALATMPQLVTTEARVVPYQDHTYDDLLPPLPYKSRILPPRETTASVASATAIPPPASTELIHPAPPAAMPALNPTPLPPTKPVEEEQDDGGVRPMEIG